MPDHPIRFAALGLNHNHVYGQARMLLDAGAELVSAYAPEPELAVELGRRYPQAGLARSAREILEDASTHLIASAAIAEDRAGIAVEAMRHGKDVLVDKPGATTQEQVAELERAQRETGRIWTVYQTETAIPQARSFLATRLAIQAQMQAQWVDLPPAPANQGGG